MRCITRGGIEEQTRLDAARTYRLLVKRIQISRKVRSERKEQIISFAPFVGFG